METVDAIEELKIVNEIVSTVAPLSPPSRLRVLETAARFLDINLLPGAAQEGQPREIAKPGVAPSAQPFSSKPDISVKEFLVQKQPRTDTERIACLAYYLTHYRNTPAFKTVDLSKLNTEAAQPKFSNASVPVNNAALLGFLASASEGKKQLGTMGEQFVLALPDRKAAKEAYKRYKVRRFRKSRRDTNVGGAT
jgi:hypothetical protein